MSNFQFTLQDLMNPDPKVVRETIVNQIHKDDGGNPMRTTASVNGTSGSLSTLSIGEAMMGIPIYGDSEDVQAKQQVAMEGLLQGALVGQLRRNEAGGPGINPKQQPKFGDRTFNITDIIPPDILAAAQEQAAAAGPIDDNAGQGGSVDNGNKGVPPDVQATAAYAHTSLTGPPVERFVQLALSKQGDRYQNENQTIRGITNNPNQNTFDCSGLIWWCLNQIGVGDFPQSSDTQYSFCVQRGTNLPTVDMGVRTRGALLFKYPGSGNNGHVAISLGDGSTIEATGHANNNNPDGKGGVRIVPNAAGRNEFTVAALIPELNYHTLSPVGGGSLSSGASASTFVGQVPNALAPNVVNARTAWAVHFLDICGFPIVKNNVISVVCWQNGENTAARYNPLATTEIWPKTGPRTSTQFNSVGVQNYATPDDGFNANKWALTHGPAQQYYAHIIASLSRGDDPHVTLGYYIGGPGQGAGHDLNTWGTGGLPYGQIAGVSAALANWSLNPGSVGVGGARLQ